MDAHEIEALSMLARGFVDLRESSPDLAYTLMLDILQGINDNTHVRQHVANATSRLSPSNNSSSQTNGNGLFPVKRIVRKSEMTARGLVVIEQEVDEGLPISSDARPSPFNGNPVPVERRSDEPIKRSPIADLLYMRWLEGLKLKWPSIL